MAGITALKKLWELHINVTNRFLLTEKIENAEGCDAGDK
jgi:hypothetical protein